MKAIAVRISRYSSLTRWRPISRHSYRKSHQKLRYFKLVVHKRSRPTKSILVNILKNASGQLVSFKICLLIKILFHRIWMMETIISRQVFKPFSSPKAKQSDWLNWTFWGINMKTPISFLTTTLCDCVQLYTLNELKNEIKINFQISFYYWTLYQCYLQFTLSVLPEVPNRKWPQTMTSQENIWDVLLSECWFNPFDIELLDWFSLVELFDE